MERMTFQNADDSERNPLEDTVANYCLPGVLRACRVEPAARWKKRRDEALICAYCRDEGKPHELRCAHCLGVSVGRDLSRWTILRNAPTTSARTRSSRSRFASSGVPLHIITRWSVTPSGSRDSNSDRSSRYASRISRLSRLRVTALPLPLRITKPAAVARPTTGAMLYLTTIRPARTPLPELNTEANTLRPRRIAVRGSETSLLRTVARVFSRASSLVIVASRKRRARGRATQ